MSNQNDQLWSRRLTRNWMLIALTRRHWQLHFMTYNIPCWQGRIVDLQCRHRRIVLLVHTFCIGAEVQHQDQLHKKAWKPLVQSSKVFATYLFPLYEPTATSLVASLAIKQTLLCSCTTAQTCKGEIPLLSYIFLSQDRREDIWMII